MDFAAISQYLKLRMKRDEKGVTTVEYAVMVALIAAVIILAVIFLGRTASSTFSCTAQAVSSHTGGC